MSTASEIDRIPASCTRRASQRGLGRVGSTPVTVTATKIGQALDWSSTGYTVGGLQRHRAIDRIGEGDASGLGRLAGQAADGEAVAAVRGDRDIEHVVAQLEHGCGIGPGHQIGIGQHHDPAVVVPSPSSAAEQIIPSETCPYVLRAAMAKPPGSTAPGNETTTKSPT